MNRLLTILFLVLCAAGVSAQWNPLNYYDSCQCVASFRDSVGAAEDTADHNIRVCVTIYQKEDGSSPYDIADVEADMDSFAIYLHRDWHLITDILYNVVWDDSMLTTTGRTNGLSRSKAYGTIMPDSALQIYVGPSTGGGQGTYPDNVDALTYAAGVTTYGSSSVMFLHEVGHALGNPHTFTGQGYPCDSGVESDWMTGVQRLGVGDFDSLTGPDILAADSVWWCDVPDSCAPADSCYHNIPMYNRMSYHNNTDDSLSQLSITSAQRYTAICFLHREIAVWTANGGVWH
jgi:hypothetical protein